MDWLGRGDDRSWENVKDGGRICRFFCCCLPAVFLLIWIIDAICGAIYYDVWSPKFDLENMQVLSFNITPAYRELGELELNYVILFSIRTRKFSQLHSIEKFSYHFTTAYNGFVLGESQVPAFRPLILGENKTCIVNSTQSTYHLPLDYGTWSSLQDDIKESSSLPLQIEIQGQVRSGLFWCMTKVHTRSCNVSILYLPPPLVSRLVSMNCYDI